MMGLEVVSRLAEGVRIWIEMPLYLLDGMQIWAKDLRVDEKQEVAWVPVNPHGRRLLGEALFPAKSRAQLKLLIEVPKESREREGEVFVRQLFEKEEVGRVTWHLVPPEWMKELDPERGMVN